MKSSKLLFIALSGMVSTVAFAGTNPLYHGNAVAPRHAAGGKAIVAAVAPRHATGAKSVAAASAERDASTPVKAAKSLDINQE
jgi:hypothetical protein